MSSIVFMHLVAVLLHIFLPLFVIIDEPATAATVPTARPMPMPFIISAVLFDANILLSLQSQKIIIILPSAVDKIIVNNV